MFLQEGHMFSAIDLIYGSDEPSLPPELEKLRVELAGENLEDPIAEGVARARLGKVAPAEADKVVDKIIGTATELHGVTARLAKRTKEEVDLTPAGILLRAALNEVLGPEDEFEPTGEETLDPTWHQPVISKIIGAASSREAVARNQRRASGEPKAHEQDGLVTQSWQGGSNSVFWRDGKIIASRLEYEGDDGVTEIEVFDGSGDPITQIEYAALTKE
jgi:hypothetical protein